MAVPETAAGKQGKCPKCQTLVRVPKPQSATGEPSAVPTTAVSDGSSQKSPNVSGSKASSKSSTSTRKVVEKTAPTKSNPSSSIGSLLDDVGLVRKSGPVCPACGVDLKPGVVLCVHCGYNLQTQQKTKGYDAKVERPEFENETLQQAVDNMRREEMVESRREKAAMPWWVLVSFLIGAVVLCGAGVVLIDANFGEPAPPETRMGRLQQLPVLVILGGTACLTSAVLSLFAHLSICAFGFEKKLWQGIACFFLPFLYSLPYGIMNWSENKAPVKGLMVAVGVAVAGTAMVMYSGSFRMLWNAF